MEKAFKAYSFEGYGQYTTMWDMLGLPNGDVYASLCTEGFPAGLNARLFRLPAGGVKLEHVVSNRRLTAQSPETGIMPHSKVHTSLQYDPDARKIYYITYTTSPGLGHEFWDIAQLFDDPVSGYPGSHFIVLDPADHHYETWGMPAPRHIIYGGCFEPNYRRYYYLASLNGRLGYVDLAKRRFQDVGRVSRRTGFKMFSDRHSRIYGLTREGQFWRYDPAADRIALLDCWVPRWKDQDPKRVEVYIQECHYLPDGRVIGMCRGGNPFWIFDPHAGAEGHVEDLGPAWPERPGWTGWSPLLADDGCLYYWTLITEAEKDVHLCRYDWRAGKRADLGRGIIHGKGLGSWVAPGAKGADGRLYWGDTGDSIPRVVVFDPQHSERLRQNAKPPDKGPPVPAAPAGAPISAHPVNSAWGNFSTDPQRTRAIAVCGYSAPHGACALRSLAVLADGTVLGLTSGHSCILIAYEPRRDGAQTRALFDTALAGAAGTTLAVLPDNRAYFSLNPTEKQDGAPLFQARLRPDGSAEIERICELADGLTTLRADPNANLLYALTNGRRLLRIDPGDGRVLLETPPLCDRQLSPALAIASDGCVYGAQRGGALWRLPANAAAIEQLTAAVPCQKGRAYGVEWQTAAAGNGLIFGGTSDGYLFRYEPGANRLVNLGKPFLELDLNALALAPDGTVYGAGGSPGPKPLHGFSHLFRWDPETGFTDLGQLDSPVHPFGVAIRIGALALAPDGTLFAGEDDDLAHLWSYQP